jgi:hypothetical protein
VTACISDQHFALPHHAAVSQHERHPVHAVDTSWPTTAMTTSADAWRQSKARGDAESGDQ